MVCAAVGYLKQLWARGPRYSIRTMLVIVAVVGVAVGVLAAKAARQRRAVATIRAAGGIVYYDFEYPGTENEWPSWMSDWLGVDYLYDPVSISYVDDATDDVLRSIGELAELRELLLDNADVTDADLLYLKRLCRVEVLSLDGANITDAGLPYLNSMTALRELHLSRTHVSGASLTHLRGMTDLEILNLNGTAITDDALRHMRGLDALEEVWLDDTDVSDAGLSHLVELPRLEQISVVGAKTTREGRERLERTKHYCEIRDEY